MTLFMQILFTPLILFLAVVIANELRNQDRRDLIGVGLLVTLLWTAVGLLVLLWFFAPPGHEG